MLERKRKGVIYKEAKKVAQISSLKWNVFSVRTLCGAILSGWRLVW